MVKLNKIYTKKGDDGTTGLADGARLPKNNPRIEAYGAVDESNAVIGVARLSTRDLPELDAMLARIQNDLFDLGADLARPPAETPVDEELRVVPGQVERLERELDALNARLEPLRSFVLPGGAPAAANLHHARAVTRRAERRIVALRQAGETVGAPALAYVNRLSDFLFVAARIANANGATDVLWRPGANR